MVTQNVEILKPATTNQKTAMKSRSIITTLSAVALLLGVHSGVRADLAFSQSVTSDIIFGSGNLNGNFTVDRNDAIGLELGLRARERYDSSGLPAPAGNGVPSSLTGDQGDSRYILDPANGNQPANRSYFNFDWSVNTDFNGNGTGQSADDFTYKLFIDYDPSAAVGSVVSFDPINLADADHTFGDNGTGNGAGVGRAIFYL